LIYFQELKIIELFTNLSSFQSDIDAQLCDAFPLMSY